MMAVGLKVNLQSFKNSLKKKKVRIKNSNAVTTHLKV